ncbi:MAG: site-specific DNA-methyltransferase, partial [Elusimicrobiota bacterium]|nr:site-specific DNA-methyltransferase [Elusimicrobiota bacterium]
QKPEALLERIIRVSSNEGDTILDCFCGGGTTIAVANKLNRNWIGIDQSVQAIKVTELRLKRDSGLFEKPFEVKLHKYDYDELKNKDPFEFQNLVIEKYGGLPNVKKKGDLGIDGRMSDNTPIQVKKSENIGRNIIDNFKSAIERYDNKLFLKRIAENKIVGHIIAFSFGTGAIGEVARLKIKENILIELKRVDDILLIATKPKITLEYKELSKAEKELKEIEIKAEVEKKNEVEFYSWDFDYKEKDKFKAAVIRDIVGVQSMKLKAGEYNIAVKVVNKDGLESIEVIKLIVNGGVKQI